MILMVILCSSYISRNPPAARCIQNSMMAHPLSTRIVSWVFQLLVAGILFQTLFFKFTAAEESVYIFSKLGMEPWGRIGSGLVELIAVILLLSPRTAALGAIITMGVLGVAIVSHLTTLGIVVKDDGGLLFGLAVTAFISSAIILFIRRCTIPWIGAKLIAQTATS
jgi:hypothetical protein